MRWTIPAIVKKLKEVRVAFQYRKRLTECCKGEIIWLWRVESMGDFRKKLKFPWDWFRGKNTSQRNTWRKKITLMVYNAGKKTYTVVRRTKKAVEVREKTSYSNQITHDPASSKSNCSKGCVQTHTRGKMECARKRAWFMLA